ncbi:protein phosphatase 1 regulatory inhibitor subunit 16B isoform X2 [Hydra vulgaris]|uniref:Protein phosphatase 1 regulatory inhibitor subunit 16B isoform X2 n=1 Tax=Hydra vulgaris TaxID=6087 RepID=A0ABM4DPD5_HYDVU
MTAEETVEHSILVDELIQLESLSPEERLAHAKKRRHEQLDAYQNRILLLDSIKVNQASHKKRIKFESNIEIIEAAARNDSDEVASFIKNGFSPNLQNEDGLSALHQAVIEDCVDVVDVLVKNGADLNIKDADFWTPLHAAVACGNFELCKYLCENGASMVEINTDGNMPIDLVEDNEDIEIYLDGKMGALYTEEELEDIRNVVREDMLRDLHDCVLNNRDLNIAGEHGETAMHIAAANGYEDVVEYLLDHGAKIDLIDNDGWQPIHAAACWGQEKIIELLVNHGADLDAKTKDGETPIDLTEDEELQGMIEDLKESGQIVRELKRSQSNSSRTLSVRRSSIVEKHRISVNDAKQEGVFRQNSEFLQVVIKTDDDNEQVEENFPENLELLNDSTVSNVDISRSEEYKYVDISRSEEKLSPEPTDSFQPSIEVNTDTIEVTFDATSPNKELDSTTQNGNLKSLTTQEEIDLETDTASNISHNTAVKRNSLKTLTLSTDDTVKKKCCIVL